MARNAIDIVSEAKRKLDKERKSAGIRTTPFFYANLACTLCDPKEYNGNNKSDWIKRIAGAAALLLVEIETIQSIKGDGIL